MRQVVTGHAPQAQPAHGNHMTHFEAALNDALNQWQGGGDATVTFVVEITPNPGGIRDYCVTLSA